MKEFIEYIAKQLVDDPDDVHVEEKVGEDKRLLITLKVSHSDTGKVIGKQGKTAAAMRILLTAVAAKHRKRATLEVLD